MSKLEKTLNDWVNQKLLTPEQAVQIQEYERTKPGGSWILSGLLILGTLVIGIGLISLIAANWDKIPPLIKLINDFTLLIALAVAIVYSRDLSRAIVYEALLFAFLLVSLASIGLISQIYNTGGELYQALLLWAVINCGVAFAARQFLSPFLWLGGLLIAVVFSVLNSVHLQPLFRDNYSGLFMAIPLFCFAIVLIIKNLAGKNAMMRAFGVWTLLSGFVAMVVAETFSKLITDTTFNLLSYLPAYCGTAMVVLGILLDKTFHRLQRWLLLLTLGLYLLLFHLPLFGIQRAIAYAACDILLLSAIAAYMASIPAKKLFQWLLLLISLRFIILYFQALGGLARTGIGLIISGILIISIAFLWHKYRKQLATWAERLTQ